MQQFFQCWGCGSQVYIGQPFCQNCGYQFTYSCPSCQASVDNRFAACPNCGVYLNWPVGTQLHPTQIEDKSSYQQGGISKSGGGSGKGSKTKPLLMVCISLVCLIVLVVGVIFAVNKFSQGATSIDNTTSTFDTNH